MMFRKTSSLQTSSSQFSPELESYKAEKLAFICLFDKPSRSFSACCVLNSELGAG